MTDLATTTPHLLRIADLTAVRLNALLELANEMRDGSAWWSTGFHGSAVACVFDEPTASAHATFVEAVERLGMLPIVLGPDEIQGKSVTDLARTLSSSTRAIVADTPSQAILQEVARAATVPVINARTCHPLADLLTIRRHFGYLDGLRLAYLGAADDVADALVAAAALAGMHVAGATPPERGPDHDVVAATLRLAATHGASIQIGHDARAAVALADVVLTGAEPYQADDALERAAASEALFLHDSPERLANRLPCAQATLHMLTRST